MGDLKANIVRLGLNYQFSYHKSTSKLARLKTPPLPLYLHGAMSAFDPKRTLARPATKWVELLKQVSPGVTQSSLGAGSADSLSWHVPGD
jgi:hypothetical protein